METSEKTLARLSFWVPSERMGEFATDYEKKIVPILKKHGLVESAERGRATAEGVFSRLFEFTMPSGVLEKREALWGDPAFQEVLRDLGTAFGTDDPDDRIKSNLMLYAGPARPGKVVSAGPGKGHWRTYDVTDGLGSASVCSIFQDREGHLWFGTNGGVSRYDGRSFTTFTIQDGLVHNRVRSIFQDREGHLWFGTLGGVSRYDGKIPSTRSTPSGRSELALSETKGQAGSGQGFTSFATRDGLAGNIVLSILQDREGVLWFGTENDGVSRYDGKTFTSLTTRDGLAGNIVRSIFQDREGYLWFGASGGVSRYDGKTFTTLTTRDGLAGNMVRSIFQDREGYLWFGTQDGVSQYDGKTFITLTTRDGLASNDVFSILEDGEGYLWFGTLDSGAIRYDRRTFTHFSTEDVLLGNAVLSIFEDREGHLWIGTNGGVSRHDSKTFTTFTARDGLAHNSVGSIFEDREGHLWFGTYGGISRYSRETFTTFTIKDGLPNSAVWSIFQDREGHLWFSAREFDTVGSGVSRYDGKTFTTFTTEDGLASNGVISIFQDREGNLWFGTAGDGVSRYDGKTPSTRSTPSGRSGQAGSGQAFTTFTTEDGLASNWVRSIFQDREGYLWFSTFGGGVTRYDPSASLRTGGKSWTTLTTKDGLASNGVISIFQDREGNLWFGTNGGVSRYDGRSFQTLTRQDGLANNAVTSIFQDREGYLWFGTFGGGVTRYRPPAPSPPPAFIDAVVADRRYEKATDLTIPSSVKLTAFEFHAISFKTRPEAMVYRYHLKGYDEAWRNTRQRRVEYQDLPVGEYIFEVLAVDRDLVYSEKPATVKVTVEPDPHIEALTEALNRGGTSGEFVGKSEALRRVQAQLSEVARTDVTVLILGETGTGKGLAARAVHALSEKRVGLFIQVNCGAIPEGLVESELFGHEKGAFTGATSRKLGKIEVAKGGTLFLDEVGDLALEAQGKLLRVLEEGTFERVGGTQTLRADARVIAATNRELRQMVAEGRFREDLYFRLQTFPVRLPSLRERREDIPLLAAYFMARMAAHLNKEVTHLAPDALALLNAYDWPGNVRELEHAVQRAVIVCRGPGIRAQDILLEFGKGERPFGETVTLEECERRHILETLERTGWAIKGAHGAAALLGLHEATLRNRMKRLGIVRPRAR